MPTTSTSENISRLSAKSNEFSSYSANDMVELCNEILNNFRNRPLDDWSNTGSWRLKECQVQELWKEGQSEPISSNASSTLSFSGQMLSSVVSNFVTTCLDNYKYEAGITTKMPELLSKVTTKSMQDGSGRTYSIYGPVPVGIPGATFELYTLPLQEKAPQKKTLTTKSGSVSVILGAGNQPALTLFDILQRTLVHREVVLAKHHPLRPHLLEPYSIILEPLIKRGFIEQVLDEGVPATVEILSHPSVGHVHITGSLATDKAVRSTIAKSKPHLSSEEVDAMVSSELGASTPFILADGEYTEMELIHAARMLVFSKKANGGCNCLDTQVIIMSKGWKQKDDFRNALYDELKRQPNQPSYYPGSRERAKEMVQVYRDLGEERVKVIDCDKTTGAVHNKSDNVTVVECGTPGEAGYEDSAIKMEAFGPVLSIVELPAAFNEKEFLNSVAVPFVNNKNNIFGSLSMTLVAPGTYDTKALDFAVEAIEYGTIGVNTANLLGWLGACRGGVWCAHPSAPGRESGAGYCGNQFKVAAPAKTVIRGQKLAKAPIFDGAKPPPKILIDAMVLMDCSHSTLVGITRIIFFFFVSLTKTILSPLMPSTDKIKSD